MADKQDEADKHDEVEKQEVAEPQDWPVAVYWLIGAVFVAVAVLGILLSRDDPGRGLAFAGTLVTAAVTLVGLVLKQSSDRQTAAENRRERERLAAAEERERHRLELESAREAAGLLSTATGSPADRATTAGALLSLVRLNQVQLASSMLFELWEQDRISHADATYIVNEALCSRDEQAQRDASNALFLKTPDLAGEDEKDEWYHWPFAINHRWMPDLPDEARYTLLRAWVYLWTESKTQSSRYRMRNLTAGLLACWKEEKDTTLRCSIARMLNEVCKTCPGDVQGAREMVNGEMETFDTRAILEEVPFDDSMKLPEYLLRLEEVLAAWLQDPNRNRTEGFLLPGEPGRNRKNSIFTRAPGRDRAKQRARPRAGPR